MLDEQEDCNPLVGRITRPEIAMWDVEPEVGTAGERMAMDLNFEDVKVAMDMSLEVVDGAFDDIAPVCLSLPKLLTILAGRCCKYLDEFSH